MNEPGVARYVAQYVTFFSNEKSLNLNLSDIPENNINLELNNPDFIQDR